METIFPQATGFSGFYLVGYRKIPPDTPQTQRVGSVVVKRRYTIVGSRLEPAEDPFGIRTCDETVIVEMEIDGRDVQVPLVVHESDIAPYKPQGDLFVKGYAHDSGDPDTVPGTISATLRVNNSAWLRRHTPVEAPACLLPEDSEIEHNLFGWEQRGFACRLDDVGVNPRDPNRKGFSHVADDYPAQWHPGGTVPDFKDPLHPIGFSNRFYNAYKRAYKRLAGDFPFFQKGDQIRLNQDPGGAHEATIAFVLPADSPQAEILYYCGHGPDRKSRWCKAPLPLVMDTLVIDLTSMSSSEPAEAYVLWRGVWNFDLFDPGAYRRLQVFMEA
jgi:hypothetical protein